MNPKRLFVGNLTYSVDEKQLWNLFSRYGEVVGVRILEGKGYGFVEMDSYEDARAAKNALNETEFEGRNLLIDDVRPKSKPGIQKGPSGKYHTGKTSFGRTSGPSKRLGDQGRPPSKGPVRGSSRGPRDAEYTERTLTSATRPPRRDSDNTGKPFKSASRPPRRESESTGRTFKGPSRPPQKESDNTGKPFKSTSRPPQKDSGSTGQKKNRANPATDDANQPKKSKTRFWPGGKR